MTFCYSEKRYVQALEAARSSQKQPGADRVVEGDDPGLPLRARFTGEQFGPQLHFERQQARERESQHEATPSHVSLRLEAPILDVVRLVAWATYWVGEGPRIAANMDTGRRGRFARAARLHRWQRSAAW